MIFRPTWSRFVSNQHCWFSNPQLAINNQQLTRSNFVSILLVITTDLGIKVVCVRNDLAGVVIFVTQHRNFDCVRVDLETKFTNFLLNRFLPREIDRKSCAVSQSHSFSGKDYDFYFEPMDAQPGQHCRSCCCSWNRRSFVRAPLGTQCASRT